MRIAFPSLDAAWGGEARPGVAAALALSAALSGSLASACLAQDAGSPTVAPTRAEAPAAGDARATLALGPCLDAPGCSRPAAPLMSQRSAIDLRSDPAGPAAVPLPAALTLMGAVMAAFAMLRRRGA